MPKKSKKLLKDLYTMMIRCRKLDQKLIECLTAGEVKTFVHSGEGHEAAGVALCSLLREDDYVFYNHRGHGINKCLPRGMPAEAILAEHYGKVTGGAGGYAGFHYSDIEKGLPGMMGFVSGELTLAAGVGLSCLLRDKGQVVTCFFGDGATARGVFHEALLLSATWKLPVVWIIENNRYQQFTCIDLTHCNEELAEFGQGYGIPATQVDGQDMLAVYDAAVPAIKRARAGKGPTLIEAKTYRYRGHVEGMPDFSIESKDGMRSAEEIDAWKKRDPISLFQQTLKKQGILSDNEIKEIDLAAEKEMESARELARNAPYPTAENMDEALYAE